MQQQLNIILQKKEQQLQQYKAINNQLNNKLQLLDKKILNKL